MISETMKTNFSKRHAQKTHTLVARSFMRNRVKLLTRNDSPNNTLKATVKPEICKQCYFKLEKNSIRDARTPQPGEIVFNTMTYRSSETV